MIVQPETSHKLTIRFSENHFSQLQDQAEVNEMSISELVRRMTLPSEVKKFGVPVCPDHKKRMSRNIYGEWVCLQVFDGGCKNKVEFEVMDDKRSANTSLSY